MRHRNLLGTASWANPDLTLLGSDSVPAPPFPKHVCGNAWSGWCEEVATSGNTPYDYVAASLITTAAGLIGNARVATFGEWVQATAVWTALIGNPSVKKSPAMKPLVKHVHDIERLLADEAADPDEAPQIAIGNITERAAHEMAERNPKGLLLTLDELSAHWQRTVGQSSEGFYLSCYDGAPYRVNRKGQPRVFIPHATVSVLGAAQPDPVRDLVQAKADRGFTSRWLYIYPEPQTGFRRPSKVDHSRAAIALRRLQRLQLGADGHPIACELTSDAEDTAEAWLHGHHKQTVAAAGTWSQWLGKQDGMLLRYALVLEHLWWAMGEEGDGAAPSAISPEAVHAAGTFIDGYAKPMAMRVFDIAARPQDERDAAILARLLKRTNTSQFNVRDVRRNSPDGGLGPVGRLASAEAMTAACDVLSKAHLIRHVGTRTGGGKGRAPETYEVNLKLLQIEEAR